MSKISDTFPAELQPERARQPAMEGKGVQPLPDTDVPEPQQTPEVKEPDPDLLPDEMPTPNPDENRDPPMRAGSALGKLASSLPAELVPGWAANNARGPDTEPIPQGGSHPAGGSGNTSGSTGP